MHNFWLMLSVILLVFVGFSGFVFSENILPLSVKQLELGSGPKKFSTVKIFDADAKNHRIRQIKNFGKLKSIKGKFNVIINDDFENQMFETEFSLTTPQGNYILYDSENLLQSVSLQSEIRVSGMAIENEIVPANLQIMSSGFISPNPALGNQMVAVILANFLDDTSTPITREDVWDRIFEIKNFNSLNNYIKESSYDKAFLNGDVFGWYTLPLNYSQSCLQGGFDNVLLESVNASDDYIDFSQFKHLIIVLANNPGCPSSANIGTRTINTDEGEINLSVSRLSGFANFSGVGITAHEFGHQLGLRHANGLDCGSLTIGKNCSVINSADVFDVMGYNAFEGQYNSFHKEQLGWLDSLRGISTATKQRIYSIKPLEMRSGVRMLKIPAKDFYYSVEFRRPINHDAVIQSTYGNGVYDGAIIHTNKLNTALAYDTQLLDTTPNSRGGILSDFSDSALKPGNFFVVNGNGVRLKVLEANDNFLKICFGTPEFCDNLRN